MKKVVAWAITHEGKIVPRWLYSTRKEAFNVYKDARLLFATGEKYGFTKVEIRPVKSKRRPKK